MGRRSGSKPSQGPSPKPSQSPSHNETDEDGDALTGQHTYELMRFSEGVQVLVRDAAYFLLEGGA